MIQIYLLEDINDLKYVGSTGMTLLKRLDGHRQNKRLDLACSSKQLNLENCSIIQLEECEKENKREREKFWINKLDTVNARKMNYDDAKVKRERYHNDPVYRARQIAYMRNRRLDPERCEKRKETDKKYYDKNRQLILEKQKKFMENPDNREKSKAYQKEWRRKKKLLAQQECV